MRWTGLMEAVERLRGLSGGLKLVTPGKALSMLSRSSWNHRPEMNIAIVIPAYNAENTVGRG